MSTVTKIDFWLSTLFSVSKDITQSLNPSLIEQNNNNVKLQHWQKGALHIKNIVTAI